MPIVRRWLLAAALVVVVAVAALVGLDATGNLPGGFLGADPLPSPAPSVSLPLTPTPSPAGSVLAALAATAPGPQAAALAAALDPLLHSAALGRPGAVVIDPRTGTALLASDADGPRVPASTAKLLTAAAVLAGSQPTDVLRTRVLSGAVAGQVVLLGGGDPTLTDRPIARGSYPRPATLDGLAAATAVALKAQGRTSVSLAVDDSLFGGPRTAPGWAPGYLPGGVVAPVAALMVDEGRRRAGHDARYADPAAAAGQAFARRLVAHGVTVIGRVSRAVAGAGAAEVAGVDSPTLPVLVESMLSRSDNDLAEALARHVALAAAQPGTFAGVRAALGDALSGLGLDLAGVVLNDGSGLSRTSQVSPRLLGDVLALASSSDHAQLRPLLSGLPVAGFTGTLADRFAAAAARGAVGSVRAKTGTLTGVSALAGVTVAADGAPLVFALMADGVPVAKTLQARDVLDQAAARLAGCGCP